MSHPVMSSRFRPRFPADPDAARRENALFDGLFLALMGLMAVVVTMTAADNGISVDEFLFDTYGAKSLSYYTTMGVDRSSFVWYDNFLYGPWFHMVVATLQSLDLAPPFDVRHIATGFLSLIGLVGVFAIGRRVFNARTGFFAVVLLLLTGNYYGHMFNSPVDAPFIVAMTWAVWGIIAVFAGDGRRMWLKVLACGILVGLAVATRVGGVILVGYVAGAATLAVLDRLALTPETRDRRHSPLSVGVVLASALTVIVVAGAAAYALWPWIQEDTINRIRSALAHFGKIEMDYNSVVWGIPFRTTELPWYYIPLNLVGRLAEPFTILLGIGLALGTAGAWRAIVGAGEWRDGFWATVARLTAVIARRRAVAVILVAAVFPLAYVVATHAVLYDGIRHVMFTVPMLALVAAWAAEWVWPRLAVFALPAAIVGGAVVGYDIVSMAKLHPQEYIRISAFAGGTRYGAPLFETDYWGNGVAEGIERLKEYLELEARNGRPVSTPRVLAGISYRENLAAPLFPKDWVHVDTREAADFAVAPTRWNWEPPAWAQPIALVRREGQVLAVVYDLRKK